MRLLFARLALPILALAIDGIAQNQTLPATDAAPASLAAPAMTPQVTPEAAQDKRIFGVLPNYRTADGNVEFHPLTARQKFRIAYKDSFDYPVFAVSAAFAGLAQLDNANPSLGQGLKGYAKRYGASYCDQMIGNIMTEGLFPTILHEDPRYFRRSTGSTKGRAAYALTRIFVTRTDSGGQRFNYSEVVGNSVATGLSNAYWPDSRVVSDNLQKLATQLATDALSNVLKEFWPDIKHRYFDKHHLADKQN